WYKVLGTYSSSAFPKRSSESRTNRRDFLSSYWGASLFGWASPRIVLFQMCSSDSTFPKPGIPLRRIPFFTIQNNSRSEYYCTSGEVRSAARGYIHRPKSVGVRPSGPWHIEQSVA